MTWLPYIWAIAGVLMIGSEIFFSDFVMFFFGLGALLTGIITLMFPDIALNIPFQFGLWIILSSVSLLTLRRYFSKTFRGSILSENRQDEMIGRSARVVEEISPDKPGRISFEGTTWKAVCYGEHFMPDDRVTIIQQEGIGYVVTQSLLPEEDPASKEKGEET